MRWTSIAAVVAIAMLAAPARAEFCGGMGMVPRVVASADIVVPGDGGVLVAAVPGGNEFDDASLQPSWTFQTGGTSTEPRRTALAPGLTVYQARLDGSLSLVDERGTTRATAFITHRARARLAAPVIKWVTRTPDSVDVFLELEAPPPDDAVAIVLVGKDGKARSWELLDEDSTTQRAYSQRGCQMAPPGTQPSSAGDDVTFFFVDRYGRRSPSTRTIRIADKTPSEKRIAPPSM